MLTEEEKFAYKTVYGSISLGALKTGVLPQLEAAATKAAAALQVLQDKLELARAELAKREGA